MNVLAPAQVPAVQERAALVLEVQVLAVLVPVHFMPLAIIVPMIRRKSGKWISTHTIQV
jgi:hypothetical protein